VRFDADYYDRFYLSDATKIDTDAHHAQLVCGVVSMIEFFGVTLERVLDVGAGVGRWGSWLREHRPSVEVVSTEMEREICDRFGHQRRDISKWRDKRRYDLVVCQGVLPYLDDDACAAAIDNLAAMTRGFLYLEAITRRDLVDVCDLEKTDTRVHRRTGAWYEKHLGAKLRRVGAGLWYPRDGWISFYELEAGR
jgi:2-polyprenyl-3-methyl-5-hydroxy-6-metoxy-1,4-benzoquinol methylase